MKWYEDEPGSVSSIRIMAMIAVCVGSFVMVAGVVAAFFGIQDVPLIVGAGASTIAVALGCKAWQASSELKATANQDDGR